MLHCASVSKQVLKGERINRFDTEAKSNLEVTNLLQVSLTNCVKRMS